MLGLCALITLALAGAASAQITAEQQSAIRANCRSDFMSKCSGVQPGGKEALQCLQKNVDALSAGCKTAVSATISAPAAATAAAPAKPAETQPQKPVQQAPAQQATVTQEAPKPQSATPAVKQEAPKPAAKKEQQAKQTPPKTAAVKPDAKPATKPEAPKQEAATTGPEQEMEDMNAREMTAFAPGAVVVAKACARSLVLHCPGEVGGGRAVACLKAYRDRGGFLGPRCNAVLELQSKLGH
jgi:outer membrane biosynthesis protein TonB